MQINSPVHPGENELVLVVRGLAAVTNPQYVNAKKDPPVEGVAPLDAQGDCNQKLAVGDNWSGFKGVWLAAQTMGGAQTSPWQAFGAEVVPAQ